MNFTRFWALGIAGALSAAPGYGQLAVKGRLLLQEDFTSLAVYTKDLQPLQGEWRVKATHPSWHLSAEGIESSWEKGHNPVLFYEAPFGDVVIEVDFRFRRETGKNAYCRIGPANRELDPRAYTVSAWVNVDSKARPPGVILEHEEWRTQGYTGVATQIATFAPDTWYTMRLEVIGDTALLSCNGVTVSGRYPKFGLPKTLLAIGVGQCPHELRRLRVYEAKQNPAWVTPEAKAQPTVPIESVPPRGPLAAATLEKMAALKPIFNGRTLDGWIQAPRAPISLAREDVLAPADWARRLSEANDPVSAYLAGQLDDAARAGLAALLGGNAGPRQTLSPLLKAINLSLQARPQLYEKNRFSSVALRPETADLLRRNPQGEELARLNRLLLEDAYPRELARSPDTGWIAKDGVLASTGAGRGVIYTAQDYTDYRLIFQVRQKLGNHFPGVLVFGERPAAGAPGLDALGGIQFAVPSAGHWDYRPGMNNAGVHFRRPLRIRFNLQEWAQVEILVNAKRGLARMAIAQPVGTRGIELLRFEDPTAGRTGPIALQMHNALLFDEYKDLRIEVNPQEDKLITLD